MRHCRSVFIVLGVLGACTLDRTGTGSADVQTTASAAGGSDAASSVGGFAGSGGSDQGPTASSGGGVGAGGTQVGGMGAGGAGGGPTNSCAKGMFVAGLATDGGVICRSGDSVLRAVVNARCRLFWGWRNECDGCGEPPSKWGLTGGNICAPGAGDDNFCVSAQSGAEKLQLFALNLDGDADENDTFFVGLHCAEGVLPPPQQVASGECPKGAFATAYDGSGIVCTSAAKVVGDYVRDSLRIYFGWRDNCNGCMDPPEKWGEIGHGICKLGVGSDSGCTKATLGNSEVNLLALNTDGDVNGDDKFYVATRWREVLPQTFTASQTCPTETFVTGLLPDKSVECRNLAPALANYVATNCPLTFGWRNTCDGCGNPPEKWGQAFGSSCLLTAGGDSGCVNHVLGGVALDLLGINTDFDVGDNDVFYTGMKCY